MRDPQFTAMIGPARLYPQIWRLLLGLGLILFCGLGTLALILVAAYPIIGPLQYFGWIAQLAQPATPAPTLVLLGSFSGLAMGAILAAASCHFRGPGTLFGPWGDTLRGFAQSVLVLTPLYGLVFAVIWFATPPSAGLPVATWLRLLPLALPLLMIQITAEELIFRGYLQQQLAARFQARWIWMGGPSILFAMLHFAPEAGPNAWLIVALTLGFALIAADLTEKTGSLGAAMGLHFANNAFALLLISVPGSITGLALFLAPYGIEDTGTLPFALIMDLVLLLAIWRILRIVVAR